MLSKSQNYQKSPVSKNNLTAGLSHRDKPLSKSNASSGGATV